MSKKDKFFGAISRIISKTGTYFMFMFLFVSFFAKIIIPEQTIAYNTALFGYALLFCLLLSVTDLVLGVKALGIFPVRVAIHFVLALTEFIVVLCYLSGVASGGKQIVFLSLFFALVYAVVMTVYALIRSARLRKENKEKTYKNEFSGTNE